MGKLLSKNKKILFLLGFVLFLSLTLIPRFALAIDPCSDFNEEECEQYREDLNCVWVVSSNPYQPAHCETAVQETSSFCPGAMPFVSWAWWKCILEFTASLPLKIPVFSVAVIGIILAILGAILLFFLQGIAGQLIYYSINFASIVPPEIGTIATEVRSLALQLLLLFLAIIGLATILKIQEYQFRKTLVPLIVVALLISFSTPIVEAVVNIGNSLTNAFFGWGDVKLGNNGSDFKIIELSEMLEPLKTGGEALVGILFTNGHFFDHFFDSLIILGVLGSVGFIMALFYISAALIICVFGLVFFIRVVFIWLLIIIAPIAFVSAVFKTKEIKAIFVGPLNWDGWWTSLLEWSFMGVGLAIWIALAMKLKDVGKGLFIYVASTPTAAPATSTYSQIFTGPFTKMTSDLFGIIFGYLGAVVALWLGATTAPGMMGQMASQVYGKAKGFVTAVAAGGAIAVGAGAIAGAKKGFGSRWAERKPGVGGTIKAGVSGIGAGVKSGLTTMTRRGFGKGLAEIAKPIPAEIKEEAVSLWAKRKFITTKEEAKKNIDETFEEEGPKGVERIVTSKLDTDVTRKAALDKLMEENKVSKELVGNSEGQRIILSDYEEAARHLDKKKMSKIERTALSLGEDFGEIARKTGIYTTNDKNKDNTKGITTYTQHIIASTKTADDVKQLQKGWWENPSAMETAQKFWTGAQWGAAARQFGKEFIESLEPIITQLKSLQTANDKNGYLQYVWSRPGLARFSETTPAQELGFSSFYELAPKSIKKDKKRYPNIKAILAEKP